MFQEMTSQEMMQVEGGITLLAAIGIGALCLLGGTALGLGTAYLVSKI